MARRNDHTKNEIKEMAIKAGIEIINEYGFANFSMRQIAKKIGYTVGTLYNIFDDYNDIILNINSVTLDEMKKFINYNINTNLDGIVAIKQLAKLYIKFANNNYNRWSALFEHVMPPNSKLPEWYNKKIEDLFNIIESILSKLIDQKSDTLKHAKIIWASVHGICILSFTNKINIIGSDSVENISDCMIENYLIGAKI